MRVQDQARDKRRGEQKNCRHPGKKETISAKSREMSVSFQLTGGERDKLSRQGGESQKRDQKPKRKAEEEAVVIRFLA